MIEQTTFFEDDTAVAPKPIIVDRSTAERWANCPAQAYLVDRRQVTNGGYAADVGSAVHDILSKCVAARVNDAAPLHQLRELAEELAVQGRPDLQAGVLGGCRRIYPLLQHVTQQPFGPERAPADIIRFDGGQGPRSGQLAADLIPAADDDSRGPIQITGEVDLLLATRSPEELELCDWKSGWRHWTAGDVFDSFQFQWYAVLIFANFPAVNRVSCRVFMPRIGGSTSPVYFTRDQSYAIRARIWQAVQLMMKHGNAADVSTVPAWPNPDKCGICPAAAYCPRAHKPESDFQQDPEAYLRDFVATQAKADAMAKVMSTAVRKTGQDLSFGDVAFGTGKPTAARAKPCSHYTPAAVPGED